VLIMCVNGVRQGFSRRIGVGLLTNVCKRPHPRSAVPNIIARLYTAGVYGTCVLPVRARLGRLKRGVSVAIRINVNQLYIEHILAVATQSIAFSPKKSKEQKKSLRKCCGKSIVEERQHVVDVVLCDRCGYW